MYNPGTGRFLQRDPLIQAGSYAAKDGPNAYQYVACQVTIATDPMGLERLILAFEGLGGTDREFFSGVSDDFMAQWYREFLRADGNKAHHLSQAEVGRAVRIVKESIRNPNKNSEGQCVFPGIAIFGYSQGGRAAIQAAEALDGQNIEVDLGFTVDPVPKGLELLPPFFFIPSMFLNVPSNAKKWYNFYQTIDTGTLLVLPIRGHPVGGASNVDVSSELAGYERQAHLYIMSDVIPLGPKAIAKIVIKGVPKEKSDWRARK